MKKRILLKFTGKILSDHTNKECLSSEPFKKLIGQIKELKSKCDLAIVIGGGNILRGGKQKIGILPAVAHQAGMLATIINGLIIKNILDQNNIDSCLLSSIVCPQICQTLSQENIDIALKKEQIIIFSGGTSAPFLTTDTNMVIRALQIGATEIFKCTDIDGIYSSDPAKNKEAKKIKKINYSDAISQKLGIIDTAALTLAEKHKIIIRVFNIFEENSLIKAWQDSNFGSLIN